MMRAPTTMFFMFLFSLLVAQVASFAAPPGQPSAASGRRVLVSLQEQNDSAAETVVAAPASASEGPPVEWGPYDSFETTKSGLMFKDTGSGSGESPEDEGTIAVHYKIFFDDFSKEEFQGELFFDSRANNPENEPFTLQYGMGQIIPGWEEGMKTMADGGTRVLIVPPGLGYGEKGIPQNGRLPGIPSNSHLRFELYLVSVDNSAFTKFRRMIPKPSTIFDGDWFSAFGKK